MVAEYGNVDLTEVRKKQKKNVKNWRERVCGVHMARERNGDKHNKGSATWEWEKE